MTISRDLSTRYGDGSGGVKQQRGKVWLPPSLLLSPEGSFDRNGPVTPTVTGDVQVVDGQWFISGGAAVRIDNTGYITEDSGTIIIRYRLPLEANIFHYAHFSINSTGGLLIQRRYTGQVRFIIGNVVTYGVNIPLEEDVVSAASYDTDGTKLFIGGNLVGTGEYAVPNIAGQLGLISTAEVPQYTESALFFPEVLSDDEIHRISTMPEAWTMENTMYRGFNPKQPEVPLNSHLRYHRNNEGPLPY